jgi:hypothetical protein
MNGYCGGYVPMGGEAANACVIGIAHGDLSTFAVRTHLKLTCLVGGKSIFVIE